MSDFEYNSSLSALQDLERSCDVVEQFRAFDSTSWATLKNQIFTQAILGRPQLVQVKEWTAGQFLRGARLAALSLISYVGQAFRRKDRDIFVGAGSGLKWHAGGVFDTLLPPELSVKPGTPMSECLYLLSAHNPRAMMAQRAYLKRQNAIVYTFLITPLREVITKLLFLAYRPGRRLRDAAQTVSDRMSRANVRIAARDVLRMHLRFCVSYILYSVFLAPFRIRRAFVVSAYSNTELCAVLRRRNVSITEVQHGIIGPVHRGYNYACASARLPTPDYVEVSSEFWRGELLAAGYFRDEQILIRPSGKHILADAEPRSISGPYYLFTGQGLMADEIVAFFEEYGKSGNSVPLLYLPHPSEEGAAARKMEMAIAALGKANIGVLANSQASTESLIKHCTDHISIYSSCHFDAVLYKGRTFVFDVIEESLMHYYTRKYPGQFIPIKCMSDILAHDGVHCG